MQINTHLKIDNELNGKVIELKEDYSKVELNTILKMAADENGLVHGGFIFCAADYAAMAAVNDPFVVLAKSETKFTAPVKVGDRVILEAKITEKNGMRSSVEVKAKVFDKIVFIGMFYTATLEKHVFEMN
ncbi:MAG: hotdog domain-containing protein [Campylobacterota bacterium]|nr:hotdog domain-containing protein [Campylobacterota bacterium]